MQWLPAGGWILPPRGHWAMSGDTFGCHDGEVLLASSGQRPRMLLAILQFTGEHPQQRIIQAKMSVMLLWRNPELLLTP